MIKIIFENNQNLLVHKTWGNKPQTLSLYFLLIIEAASSTPDKNKNCDYATSLFFILGEKIFLEGTGGLKQQGLQNFTPVF